MTREADQELLSAYLDGELSVGEQSRVEQLLADDQAYRQLYDELRALRAHFEGLPKHPLPQDLRGPVLRQAEQAILKGTAVGRAAGASEGDARDHGEPEPLGLRWPRGWRPWLWPALALAAALLVMIFNPPHQRAPRKLAKAPADPPDIAIGAAPRVVEQNGKPANGNSDKADSDNIAAGAAEAQDAKSPARAVDKQAARAVEKQAARNRIEQQATKTAPGSNAQPANGQPANAPVPGMMAAQPAAPPQPNAAPLRPLAPAADGVAAKSSPSEPAGPDRKATDAAPAATNQALAKRGAAQGSAAPAAAAQDGAANRGRDGRFGGAPQAAGGAPQAAGGAPQAASSDAFNGFDQSQGVLVVDCILRPEAARDDAFGKLLAKNQITVEPATQLALRQSGPGQPAAEQNAAKRDAGKQEVAEKDATKQAAGKQEAGLAKPGSTIPAQSVRGVVPVYVEASRQQIANALAEMYSDRQRFFAMRVQPAANAPAQQSLRMFSRLRPAAPVLPLAAAAPQTVAGISSNLGQVRANPAANSPAQSAANPAQPAANSAQPASNSAQPAASSAQPAPGGAKPGFRITLGPAMRTAPSAAPGQQLSADPLLASPALGAGAGNQPLPSKGTVHFEAKGAIHFGPAQVLTAPGGPASSQHPLRVLFLVYVTEPVADAAPTAAKPPPAAASPAPAAAPPTPAAASPVPSATSPAPKK